jgi:hypothetical protein
MKCLAKTRSGTPCQKPSMANGRCRLHGGLTPIKHDKYSKATLLSVREWLERERFNQIAHAMKLLEPYLDDTTKEGLELAVSAYLDDGIKV